MKFRKYVKFTAIMRTLDPPRFYCGHRRFRVFELLLSCDLNWSPVFRQVHSSFATFVVAPTQRGHTIEPEAMLPYLCTNMAEPTRE